MGLILFPIFGAINAMIAKSKGYNAVVWSFAAGILGLIVLHRYWNSRCRRGLRPSVPDRNGQRLARRPIG